MRPWRIVLGGVLGCLLGSGVTIELVLYNQLVGQWLTVVGIALGAGFLAGLLVALRERGRLRGHAEPRRS